MARNVRSTTTFGARHRCDAPRRCIGRPDCVARVLLSTYGGLRGHIGVSTKPRQQKIIRERRQYNQWVASQTLEDYALRFTAVRARQVDRARRQHRARPHRVSGVRSHRRHAHPALRIPECGLGHRRIRGADVPHRSAHRLLRREIWRGHRPADARRRLRLHGLHRDFADLCVVHVPAVRHRGQHHVGGVEPGVRHPHVDRAHLQLAGGHPHCALWHQPHQQDADHHAAHLADPAVHPHRHHRVETSGGDRGVDPLRRRRRHQRHRRRVQLRDVRPRGVRAAVAAAADRRAGGLPAVPAERDAAKSRRLVDGGHRHRPGLGAARRLQTTRRGRSSRCGRCARAYTSRRRTSPPSCITSPSARSSSRPRSRWC